MDPSILAWGISCSMNLCFFDCCCSLVIRRCLLVCLWVCCFACVCVFGIPSTSVWVCDVWRERKHETDLHDNYFNLFREYFCTGAVHWAAPACQVCLIMQNEQKNALQMSDFVPKDTKLWQTSWTLRERWCKPNFCWIDGHLCSDI